MKNPDAQLPYFLIFYASLTVVVAVFAPEDTPESVKISILVSGQTALGGAAGMARNGSSEIENIERVDSIVQRTTPEESHNIKETEK